MTHIVKALDLKFQQPAETALCSTSITRIWFRDTPCDPTLQRQVRSDEGLHLTALISLVLQRRYLRNSMSQCCSESET